MFKMKLNWKSRKVQVFAIASVLVTIYAGLIAFNIYKYNYAPIDCSVFEVTRYLGRASYSSASKDYIEHQAGRLRKARDLCGQERARAERIDAENDVGEKVKSAESKNGDKHE